MKRFLFIIGAISLLLIACSKSNDNSGNGAGNSQDNNQPEPTLTLSKNEIPNLDSSALKVSIKVTTNQKSWDVTDNADWISTSKDGDTLNIEVSANEGQEPREGIVTITAGTKETKLTIKQNGKSGSEPESEPESESSIKLDPTALNVGCDGGKFEVNVKSTQEWSAELETVAEWLSINVDNEKNVVNVDVLKNTLPDKRSLNVLVKDIKGTVVKLLVEQSGVDNNGGQGENEGDNQGGDSGNEGNTGGNNEGGNPTEIDPKPNSTNFKHRVMGLFFTGTRCSYCPNGLYAINQIMETEKYADNVIFVEFHTSSPSKMFDGFNLDIMMKYGDATPSIDFNMMGYPQKGLKTVNLIDLKKYLDGELNTPTKVGIAAKAYRQDNKIVVDAYVKASVKEQYRMGIWVLEDGIEEHQSNSTVHAIPNIDIHNKVFRKRDAYYNTYSSTNSPFDGVDIPSITPLQPYQKTVKIDIDPKWDISKCRVVVFVSAKSEKKKNEYAVTNIISCNLGETKPFEYVN